MTDGYQVRVSHETEDPAWDGFLARAPGGHHVQTSLWAQMKSMLGWRAVRIVVTRRGEIVAGAQMLMRPVRLIGAVAYTVKGPLFTLDDPVLSRLVIHGLNRIAKANGVRYLAVQPSCNDEVLGRQLLDSGFRPSSVPEVTPAATVLIDLTADLADLLARMKSRRRYSLRVGQRKGVTFREGTERDLPIFYRLLVATGRRQRFTFYPESYYCQMWRVFAPHGYVKLFVAEYQGEAVSAQLAVTFGDTVFNKLSVWSGLHGDCRPNEVLHWRAIEWAKSQGYRYYDFEGIDPTAARAILQGENLPDSLHDSITAFKLSFGGQITLFPDVYDRVYNPVLRWAYTSGFPKIANSSLVKRAVNRIRTG